MPPEPASFPERQDCSALQPLVALGDLRKKIAAELDLLRADLEDLGVQLCLDEEVMLRCMTHLQKLDEMGQRCQWLSALIHAENPADVVSDITLQSLGDRLTKDAA